ncbi:MAG: hypothetical protein WCO55_02505 [Candidatus Falkowbacteria bacterium]
MSKQLLGILAIVFGVIAVIAIVFFLYTRSKSAPKVENPASAPVPEITLPAKTVSRVVSNEDKNATSTVSAGAPGSSTPADTYQASFGVVANNFAERFGTYSNQVALGLTEDLELITTAKMQSWLKAYYKNMATMPAYQQYYSMTSKAVTNAVNGLDENAGTATVTVQMFRTENKQGVENTFNQSIKISLSKEGKSWKVNAAYWQ